MKLSKLKDIIKEELKNINSKKLNKSTNNSILEGFGSWNSSTQLTEGPFCDGRRTLCCTNCASEIPEGTVGGGCTIYTANCSCDCVGGSSAVGVGATIQTAPDTVASTSGMGGIYPPRELDLPLELRENKQLLQEEMTMAQAGKKCLSIVDADDQNEGCSCSAIYLGPNTWTTSTSGCSGGMTTGGTGVGPRDPRDRADLVRFR